MPDSKPYKPFLPAGVAPQPIPVPAATKVYDALEPYSDDRPGYRIPELAKRAGVSNAAATRALRKLHALGLAACNRHVQPQGGRPFGMWYRLAVA